MHRDQGGQFNSGQAENTASVLSGEASAE